MKDSEPPTKHLFSRQRLPILVTSLTDPTPTKTICTMRNAIFDGTDAFMLHMEALKQEHICENDLMMICNYAGDKPLYQIAVGNVAADDLDPLVEAVGALGRRDIVEQDHFIDHFGGARGTAERAARDDGAGQPQSQESGAAGDNHFHSNKPFRLSTQPQRPYISRRFGDNALLRLDSTRPGALILGAPPYGG